MSRDFVVRAIDVGYGNTKYISDVVDGVAQAAYFPSIVSRPGANTVSLRQHQNVIDVKVKGNTYLVGPGLDPVMEGGVRTLNENYVESEHYLALIYGALYQMNVSHIDLLVLGLPVSLLKSKRAILEKRIAGKHHVANRTVHIRKVLVVAQPLGGFMQFATLQKNTDALARSRNLLIDPGFFTVDFMVATGLREVPGSSGSHASGVSAYLLGIAKQISKDFDMPFDNISHIDEGLKHGDFRLFGKPVDLDKYHKKAMLELNGVSEVIANSVGNGSEIDRVIMVGGGAVLFRPFVKYVLPRHTIDIVPDAITANVLGFQKIGEAFALEQKKKVA